MPRSLTPLLVALLVMYSVQQMLTPVIAPLSHDLALTTTQLGLVFTVAAVALTLASPLWGLLLDAAGPRPVLITGLGLSVLSLTGFAAAVTFGTDETLMPDVAFVVVLVFRSLLFGAGLAALPVAALAVAGTAAHTETGRTTAVGLIGAAQGLATVIGPVVGGTLAVVSLSLPLHLAPAIAVLLTVVVLLVFKPAARSQEPVRSRTWELLPAFGVGLLTHLALGLVQVVAVFFAADRLDAAPGSVDGVLFAAGLGLVLAQGVLVPLLKWSPARLMRIGTPIALAGYALIAAVPALMTLAFLVVAVGAGFAITGFAAAASLGVGPRHQGLIAGLVTATSGVTFIVGPGLSTVLYDVDPLAPVIAAGVAAALAVVLSLLPVTGTPSRPAALID
ncbi:MFS transporter [Lentzea sp. E54]|uniref:MFS transporter n=1 Tax=Lentzea xerophila TaxID=3435883 RepID=UPI003DA54D25